MEGFAREEDRLRGACPLLGLHRVHPVPLRRRRLGQVLAALEKDRREGAAGVGAVRIGDQRKGVDVVEWSGPAENLKTGQGITYAEKIMISRENQVTPFHTHKVKTEDIIVRGGAQGRPGQGTAGQHSTPQRHSTAQHPHMPLRRAAETARVVADQFERRIDLR